MFLQEKMDFSKLDFQLHPIITPLILDQLAHSLPKTNNTFHQLYRYAKKDVTFLADFSPDRL